LPLKYKNCGLEMFKAKFAYDGHRNHDQNQHWQKLTKQDSSLRIQVQNFPSF